MVRLPLRILLPPLKPSMIEGGTLLFMGFGPPATSWRILSIQLKPSIMGGGVILCRGFGPPGTTRRILLVLLKPSVIRRGALLCIRFWQLGTSWRIRVSLRRSLECPWLLSPRPISRANASNNIIQSATLGSISLINTLVLQGESAVNSILIYINSSLLGGGDEASNKIFKPKL